MVKGVIFDLDGTLLNTLKDLVQSVECVLDDYGYPHHPMEEYEKMVGWGFGTLITTAMPKGLKEDIYAEAVLKFAYYYDQYYMDMTTPYDKIQELLEELKKRGILMGVNSNKRDDYTKNLIKRFFGEDIFIDVLGSKPGIPFKPDPTLADTIRSKMGLKAEEVLYVGDSEIDMETGHNAQLKSVGVSWGFRNREILKAAKADIIIDEPLELLNYLD